MAEGDPRTTPRRDGRDLPDIDGNEFLATPNFLVGFTPSLVVKSDTTVPPDLCSEMRYY